ncbi:MAG: 2-amino-4-hydroxy-6-hydroxymethyldihydropteridine diphosphokinase [Actinomycetota bacterium]|nr:2-amino-4-hydroxy-6-hydroxymethyldihydropteridine diphosphokinase [Actinomycetota bacterium]
MRALISIGSNLDDPIENCRRAIEMLNQKLVSVSSLYQTSPVETIDEQGFYINISAIIETAEDPIGLLRSLQGIEDYFDRRRPHFHAARTMDIDIISIEEIELDAGPLIVPHPRSSLRLFVLLPTYEIASELAVKLASPEALQFLRVLEVGESIVAKLDAEVQEITRISDASL